MNELNAMRIYIRVTELKSFSGAATSLGLPKSSVSLAVQQLEDMLCTRLLNRTTRRVTTTNDGETFYHRCKDILADMEELKTSFQHSAHPLSGRLRVDMPQALCRNLILPKLPAFLKMHPALEIELSSTDRKVDLIEEGFDCVLRVGELTDSSLIAKKLGEYKMINCVSSAYITEHGEITELADLHTHFIIRYSQKLGQFDPGFEYVDKHGKAHLIAMSSQLTVNNTDAYKAACIAGLGLIQTPKLGVINELNSGLLHEVLPQYRLPSMPINLLYANRRHVPKRTQIFMDWLTNQLQSITH
ncbi:MULTISPECIES: LysR family transcriptional regulator [Pseudoalteromonas]|uniref:LysR family transcriptional regulator n=1 Tax=Pseudoalteromonas TaxID=53246 RepID=UPI00030FCFC4|nr:MULTISPECIES: LysR family transcriptional regulator [Pseudoalteromonas]MCF6146595.1 hypothetical protein [Pseudoalteromonas mariniglutinosa NCIMB 1770]